MSAEFTSGPWSAKHIAGNNFAVQCFDIRGMFGETPHTYPIFNRDETAIDGAFVYTNPANARLIAAAPELYADAAFLCARIRELEGEMTDDDELSRQYFGHVLPAVARMEAALAKAGGGQ